MLQQNLMLKEDGISNVSIDIQMAFLVADDQINVRYEGAEFAGNAELTGVQIATISDEGTTTSNYSLENAQELGFKFTEGDGKSATEVNGKATTKATNGAQNSSTSKVSHSIVNYYYTAPIKHTYTVQYINNGLSNGVHSSTLSIAANTYFSSSLPLK